jgi:hypothetical protein
MDEQTHASGAAGCTIPAPAQIAPDQAMETAAL